MVIFGRETAGNNVLPAVFTVNNNYYQSESVTGSLPL